MQLRSILTGLIILFCISTTSYSQITDLPPELASKLTGKKKIGEIMNEVDKYYKANDFQTNPKLFSEYKKWNRWAWWAARHLNDKGEVEPKTAQYFEEARKMKVNTVANRLGATESNGGAWQPVGPFSTSWGLFRGSRGIGRIDRIVFHPTNSNIILAGSPSGGLWRTNDAGNNWFSISSSIPNCGVAGIVFSNNDPTGNTIYILTGDANSGGYFLSNYNFNQNVGILVTYNGGFTWSKLGNSEAILGNFAPFKLLQLRNAPNRLFAATGGGIYSSTDFGVTWAQIFGTTGTGIFDIEQHPTADAVLYYCTTFNIAKSVDFGESFTNINNFTPALNTATRSQLAVTPANPNEVYYLQCGTTNNTNTIYKSVNNGLIFNIINNANLIVRQQNYNFAFAINPINNNFMVAAGFSLAASNNNGATFPNVTIGNIGGPGQAPGNYLHPDIHDLAYNPLNGLLYASTDGGVAVSSDNGVNWTDISNGLQCTQYYHMEGFEGVQDLYIGGTQDNGTHYTSNGSSMVYAGSGDGFSVDFVNTDNDIFFMVENTSVSRYKRSTNTLATVSSNIALGVQTFFPDVICHPTNGNIVYVAYANSIWRTANQGTSWTQLPSFSNNDGTGGSRTYNGGFAVSPQQPDRIYAASANTVRVSNDQGNNWSVISGNNGWSSNFGTITDIATSSSNANEIWVTTSGSSNGANRIFHSSNAGASWVNLTGSLPNVPVSIFYTSDGDAYIGTELGVFFKDFAMNDWVPFYNGLPIIPVTDLFVNEANGNISAATMGRGIWRSDLYNDCGPFMFLGGLTQGTNFYQSNGFIETKQEVPGSYGNQLRLRSATKIILKAGLPGEPGFSIKNGAYMHAIIGNCGQGIFNRMDSSGTVISKGEYIKMKVPAKD
jgi:hypothetical protein